MKLSPRRPKKNSRKHSAAIKTNSMTNKNPNLFQPAATMTKLEAVAVELFARQCECAEEYRSDYLVQLSKSSIESAATILSMLGEYQREEGPDLTLVHNIRTRIVQAIQKKNLYGSPLTKILKERYNIDELSLIAPDEEADLANYLETI